MLNNFKIAFSAFWQQKLFRFVWLVVLILCASDAVNRIWITQDTGSRQLTAVELVPIKHRQLNPEWFEPVQQMLKPLVVQDATVSEQPKREDSFMIDSTEIKLLAIYMQKQRTALLSIQAKEQQPQLLSLTLSQQTDYFTVSEISRTTLVVTLKDGKKVQLKLFVPVAQKVKNLS